MVKYNKILAINIHVSLRNPLKYNKKKYKIKLIPEILGGSFKTLHRNWVYINVIFYINDL